MIWKHDELYNLKTKREPYEENPTMVMSGDCPTL